MINFNIYNKRHSTKASRRRERSWTTLEALLSPSLDIFRALALIGPLDHHHRLPLDPLLRLLSGLLLLSLDLLLISSSIDISSQCLVVLPYLLKFFLD
jgi:hypothetical protein